MVFAAAAVDSTALVACHIGADDVARANQIVQQSLLLAIIIGVSCTILIIVLAPAIMSWFGAAPNVAQYGVENLRTVGTTLTLTVILLAGTVAVRGAGDTRSPLYIMLMVNAINIVVAYCLIDGVGGLLQLGVTGSAIGPAVARGVGGLVVLVVLWNRHTRLRLKGRHWAWDAAEIRRILKIGGAFWPGAIRAVRRASGVRGRHREVGYRLFRSLRNFNQRTVHVVNAWLWIQLGRDHTDRLVPGRAPPAGCGVWRLGRVLPCLCHDDWHWRDAVHFPAAANSQFHLRSRGHRTRDPSRSDRSPQPTRLGRGNGICCALRGAGDTRGALVVMATCTWGIRLLLGILLALPLRLGLAGAWTAVGVDFSVRGLWMWLRFRHGRWKEIEV